MKFASKRQNSLIKSGFKGQIVTKFDLGLLNSYNIMYFYRNIIENKDGKKSEGSYLSCVRNGEFYFSLDWSFNGPYIIRDSSL